MAGQKHFLQIVQYVSAKHDLEGYQRAFIGDIISNTKTDLLNRYVEGEVLTAFACFQTKKGWSKKLLVWDHNIHDAADTRDAIPIFLRGPSGRECAEIREKDTIIILGAKLDTCPSKRLAFQIIVDSSHGNVKVWLVKATASTHKNDSDLNVRTAAPPAKKTKLIQQPCNVDFYTKLADLQGKSTVNLYGAVKFFKSPFKSKGLDLCTTISLVDPSIHYLENSFKSVLFKRSKEDLPQIRSVGNIVRFRNLCVGQFNGELQGKVHTGFSWLVFDGSPGASLEPISSSPGSYTITDVDKRYIQELRTWSAQHKSLKPPACDKTIAEISPNSQFFNLTCQIIARARTCNTNSVILTVIDGTTPCCQAVHSEPVNKATKVMAEESIYRKAAGKMVDVFLQENHAEGLTDQLHPGDYIVLNNIHAVAALQDKSQLPEAAVLPPVILRIHKGTICGRGVQRLQENDARFAVLQERLDSLPENPDSAEAMMGGFTQIRAKHPVPGETASGAGREDGGIEAEENLGSLSDNLGARALQTSCTITEHPYIPFSTIESIRSSPTVPSKFRCRAKALAYLPDSIKDFVQNCCHSCRKLVLSESDCLSNSESSGGLGACPRCGEQTRSEYLFSLVLEDETGYLHAMLFQQDAEMFLPDLPPPDQFLKQIDHQENVRQILTSLTLNPDNLITQSTEETAGRKRPWLECCIASYCAAGESGNTSARVLYRIFHTTCVND